MATDNLPDTTTVGVEDRESRKRVSYVSKDLKSMVEFVGKVYNHLGHTEYNNNKAIAAVHGLSPDSIKLHLSNSQQYKLLELKHGTGYKITEHFQRIFLPRSDNEKRAAVIESLKNPETYQQLFRDYEYHTVPLDGVKNHFIRSFSLKDDVATKAAQVFIDNLKDFDLLDGRGVLTSGLPSKPIIAEVKPEVEDLGNQSNDGNVGGNPNGNNLPVHTKSDKVIFQSELDAAGNKTIPIYLTEDKKALFVYPNDINEDDIELVKHQIEGVLLRIKLESKKKAKENLTQQKGE
ncbi:MAG: hypothetical protein QM668_21520 [Agriterribacter sp.]